MEVKIDTKQRFHVITIQDTILSANMTEELSKKLLLCLENKIKNVVLKLGMVEQVDEAAAQIILNIQQTYYDKNASFVICELQKSVEEFLDKLELMDLLNVTLTESEAWDIVQMEEIERELLE